MRPTVGFVSLGCPKNLVDTENMIQKLSESDVLVTGNEENAHIVVINTCGFLDPAKQESLGTIREYVQRKKEGKLKGVVVTGCMTERYLGLMQESFPEVDAFLRTSEFSQIGSTVNHIWLENSDFLKERLSLVGETMQLKGHSELPDFIKRTEGIRSYAYVKIAEGCNRTCTFCIIPKLRGKLHSRSIVGILDEVRQLADQGVKEIILIAQDLTSYGRDRRDDTSLLKLLEGIEKVEGIKWVRLLYNYPRFFTEELIEFLAQSEKFTRYLDIPFQHISDPILKQMRRPESSKEIYTLIETLRDKIPNIFLRTTLMAGFPGETEEDFDHLLRFVEEVGFHHLGAFTYWREEGTPSWDLPNQVPENVKLERHHRLMMLQKSVQKKLLKNLVGKEMDVVIDGLAEKTKEGYLYRGRHQGQAPDIDGMTYVFSQSSFNCGQILSARAVKMVGDYDLWAEAGVAQRPAVRRANY